MLIWGLEEGVVSSIGVLTCIPWTSVDPKEVELPGERKGIRMARDEHSVYSKL